MIVLPSTLIAYAPEPGLLFGLLLGAGILAGYLARWMRIPRVVGYLLCGTFVSVVLRLVLKMLADANADDSLVPYEVSLSQSTKVLGVIKDLALGLILFSIGSVFELAHLRSVGPRILRISICEIVAVALFVFVGTAAAGWFSHSEFGMTTVLVYAVMLSLAAIATAPAATLFVLQEYESKGPMTDTILSLTAMNNIVCIVLFYTAFQLMSAFGLIETTNGPGGFMWFGLVSMILGSVAIGIIAGFLLSVLHGKLPIQETFPIFFAAVLLLGAGEGWLFEHIGISYNFLLTSLIMGGVFSNIAIDADRLHETVQKMGTPIFVGFFALAGFELHVSELGLLGVVGLTYVAGRVLGKYVGCLLGIRWIGSPAELRSSLGMALLCQAAVVIGLASFVSENWAHELAHNFEVVVLGSVVMFELSGPILVKHTVRRCGEVKAITLLRRPQASAVEGESMTRFAVASLFRMFGFSRKASSKSAKELQASDIMRTNIKFIRADADFDEVLHFVEQSRYNHFPVVGDGNVLIGVIHFSDLRDILYDPIMHGLISAMDLVDPDSPFAVAEKPLGDLLVQFHKTNISSIVIVDHPDSRKVVGLVEQRDLLRTLHKSGQ